MVILAKMLGGSHAYGLNTSDSDLDYRYVFLNERPSEIIGLDRYEAEVSQKKEEDSVGYELRRFLQLLRKTNTQVVEMLYNDTWIDLDFLFQSYILDNKDKLIDSKFFFRSLMGYIQGERRLTLGERTGQLGSKRKQALDKYGYSPKNFINLIRLAKGGCIFFTKGYFPVNWRKEDEHLADSWVNLKLHPEHFSKEDVLTIIDWWEEDLKKAFDQRDQTKDKVFDLEYANWVIMKFYLPILNAIKL